MIKKVFKYTLLVICILVLVYFGYNKIEEKNKRNLFINNIIVIEGYNEERIEDYFNYYKIHPSFEIERIVVEVNKSDDKVVYYDSFIDLVKQPNLFECLKYLFKNKEASINDVTVLSNKQLLDITYDDVLARYIHLEIDGATIRKCVGYSKKYSEIEPNDVICIINFGLEDIEPSKQLLDLIYADFFIPARVERYLKLYQENSDYTPRQVVEIVNCDADRPFYTDVEPSDLSKGILVINNKYHYLESDYVPANLVVVDKKYSSYGARMEKEAYEAFVEMCEAARKELLEIKIQGDNGYRSYDLQKAIYNYKKSTYGTAIADSRGARAGHSEHQTGLAVDIEIYPLEGNTTYSYYNMFEWSKENCWYYGFIYRYQAGKEHLTGYNRENWHYRYVGKEVAMFIKEHDITFDEYYTYFIKGY